MAFVNEPNLIEERAKGDRFWDQYVTQQFTTTDGFKAIFTPTVGGSNTAWQNREVMFGVEIQHADGRSESRNIAAGIFESVTTRRSSSLATIKIASLAKPMKEANAEKVKDGSQWYEGRPVSYVLNKLLESVFKTKDGYLADTRRLSRELLQIPTLSGRLDYWPLGIPPYWDGSSFKPSATAFPVTALAINVNRNIIYVGLGGCDGIHVGELWQYDIDNNLWGKLGETGEEAGDTRTNLAAIRQLWFNTKDEHLYGVLWRDWGNNSATAENPANKLDWICPTARLFALDTVDPPGGNLNSPVGGRSLDLGNIWTGQWDVREMWRHDSNSEIGIKRDDGPGPYQSGDDKNEANVHKLDARASAGNFTAFKYVSVPFGPIGQQGGPTEDLQVPRRASVKYHSQPSRDNYEDDPLMATWGNEDYGTAYGELIPTTSSGSTAWTSASGTTPPDGWSRAGSAQFSVAGGILTVSNIGSDSADGLNMTISGIEDNMTTYRLRIDGGANYELYISNSAHGINSMPYGPISPTNSRGYSDTYHDTGDYYFSVLSTNAIDSPNWENNDDLYFSLRRRDSSGVSTFSINNISLTVARYWDKWWGKDLDLRQSGENIPIISYSKIMAGCTVRYPPHEAAGETSRQSGDWDGPQATRYFASETGPNFGFYDPDITETSVLAQPGDTEDRDGDDELNWEGKQRNEDIFCEFNLVGQDRRLLSGSDWDTAAYNPMYGPSEAEDGISPDNSRRFQVGVRNITPPLVDTGAPWVGVDFSSSSYSNEMCIVDMGPRVSGTSPSEWNGQPSYVADQVSMQTGPGGYGYASVQLQAVGARALDGTESDDFAMSGMVRYTNGQQGFFIFSQEADNGNGAILYASFDDTDGPPPDDTMYDWGPNGGTGNRFEIKYHGIICDDGSPSIDENYTKHATAVGSGKIPTRRTLSSQTPYLIGDDAWTAIYPTAGCADDLGNFYIGTIEMPPAHTVLFTGSNESDVHARSYIYKLAVGTGGFPASGGTSTELYDSSSDASVYNVDGVGGCYGMLNNDYASATGVSGSVNNTRKIGWLHFNPLLSAGTQICGWSFRRDSIIEDPSGGGTPTLAIPCNEVFITDGTTSNKLTIVDHDVADGINMNAVAFWGFCNSEGNLAPGTTDIGEQPGTWYFRQKQATLHPTPIEIIGKGIQVNYMYNDALGNLIGGIFWDDAITSVLSNVVKSDEAFIGSRIAIVGLNDFGLDTEREAIFSSFDHYIDYNHISDEEYARSNPVWTSTKQFFKLDDTEVDHIVDLFDFTGLKVYDAITRIAWAHNFVFGFDIDKFFIVSRDLQEITHTLEGEKGDILDITKTIDNTIRNVISIQPYIPQVQDVDWEITHVGEADEELADPTLFHGDVVLQVNTHKEVSMNLVCTRKGRLVMNQFGEEDVENPGQDLNGDAWHGEMQDAIDDVEDRMVPMFKFKVNAPTKSIVLMYTIGVDSTEIYVNTTFAGGLSPIVPGDLLVFSNPTTFEQVGRVITAVDSVNNILTIEEGPGFVVQQPAPLNVASANTGDRITSDGNINQTSYGTTYSDEGVCVITAVNHSEELVNAGMAPGEGDTFDCTSLTVNNLAPFRGFKFTPYNSETYKHYSFMVTTEPSGTGVDITDYLDPPFAVDWDAGDLSPLPDGEVGQTNNTTMKLAWVYKVDEDAMKIYLNGIYNYFTAGQILNIHYCMQPATLIKKIRAGSYEPPPYQSVLQDLPEGLASWHWVVDEVTDLFNVGDIINFKFKGIKLVKDSASIYTGADMTSINKYGEKPWTFPDNRFMGHNRVEYWVSRYLQEYSHPKMLINATIPYKHDLGFMNPAGNLLRSVKIIDEVMFPGIAGFSVTGYMTKLGTNLKNFKMDLTLRTEEQY